MRATAGTDSLQSAGDCLCAACAELLEVDGAAVSLIFDGVTHGILGANGAASRRLEDLQFTVGEGPSLDAVRDGLPVLVNNLVGPEGDPWPVLRDAAANAGVRAMYALPIVLAGSIIGTLTMFRCRESELTDDQLVGGLTAARVAAVPLQAAMSQEQDWAAFADGAGSSELASVQRLEVYQATGRLIEALDISAAQALLHLRTYAFLRGLTAPEVARAMTQGEITPADLAWRPQEGP